jgi:hypothetical protein
VHVDDLLKNNNSKLAVITNTAKDDDTPVNWETDGGTIRDKYYNFAYAGSGVINGTNPDKDFWPDKITVTEIDNALAVVPPLTIKVSTASAGPTTKKCDIDVELVPKSALPSGLKLFVVIIENSITCQEEWGVSATVNGQKTINNIARQYLPDGNGVVLDAVGTTATHFKYTYEANNAKQKVDPVDTRVVVFVQNTKTKVVLDAYATAKHPFQNTGTSISSGKIFVTQQFAVSNSSRVLIMDNLMPGVNTISLYTASGKVVYKSRKMIGNRSYTIPSAAFPAGILLVSVTNGMNTQTQPVMIK